MLTPFIKRSDVRQAARENFKDLAKARAYLNLSQILILNM
jgi:hypothetical protein